MKDDGGPAFPVLHTIDGNWAKEPLSEFRGMTLRDYFAAKAMAGVLASADPGDETDQPVLAKWCYRMADAMLEERTK
jgi:hypothetical protein